MQSDLRPGQGSIGLPRPRLAPYGANYANAAGGLITDAGNARAAGQVGSANAWANGWSGVGNTVRDVGLMRYLKKV